MSDGRRGMVWYLSRNIGGTDAGRAECNILLEPGKRGRDRGAQIRGGVDHDGDVGGVEGGARRKGGSVGSVCE